MKSNKFLSAVFISLCCFSFLSACNEDTNSDMDNLKSSDKETIDKFNK